MRVKINLVVAMLIATSACGEAQNGSSAEASQLSEMQTNSFKRQCVNVAVLQQVPTEGARSVCDCTVERLIEENKLTSSRMATEEEQQVALDGCIDDYFSETSKDATGDQ